jgi:hypothetical protein
MLEIQSKKTGLKQLVTAQELTVMQQHSGKHAFTVLREDATPEEVKQPVAKKKEA